MQNQEIVKNNWKP